MAKNLLVNSKVCQKKVLKQNLLITPTQQQQQQQQQHLQKQWKQKRIIFAKIIKR